LAQLNRGPKANAQNCIILAKQRQGKIQAAHLRFEQGRFLDPTEAFSTDFAFSGGAV
jgi:hypothetical protein